MVKLATTWFDLQQNDNNKVFVGDGIVFVREAKKRGVNLLEEVFIDEKYGSIVLDACYSEKHPRICPVEEFTRSNVIQDIAGILSEDGVVDVAVVVVGVVVVVVVVSIPIFKMLVCTHRKNWSFDDQKGRFMDNCRVVDDRFDFRLRDVLSKI
ncbi:unnamed protein product [Angiostrongylus costaricensis]|uniref:Transmembrane protein n=1 Tax=Angiostrongylus costaricensis TaxID=334426 RepID=A0A0R3Q2C8_ANGCS|nr:unnamed protein product [Angiostrongylus costaricensis]